MGRHATVIELTGEERTTLEGWVHSPRTEQRMAFRARIVLLAADGMSTGKIAEALDTWPPTVSKWRTRFGKERIGGLQDARRPGAKRVYDEETERRILAVLDGLPPTGYATWNGRLIAGRLGDVSKTEVWRVLRRHGIQLQRRRSWCVSTDPQFAAKAADIVGLYLDPPENAVVLSVDEKPSIQALERAQGYLKLPNGRAITGQSHEYTRHGTTTLFGALAIATGLVKAGHYRRRRRREFLDFMNQVIPEYPDKIIHVILDNLSTHKPKNDRWLARHPNVQFHYTPTHASWLNQIECWFSILSRMALNGGSFTSPRQLRDAIDAFIEAYNETAAPFEWTKRHVEPTPLTHSYAKLRK
jgi:transposase